MEYLDRAVQWAEECDLEVPVGIRVKLAGTQKADFGHGKCLNSAGGPNSLHQTGDGSESFRMT